MKNGGVVLTTFLAAIKDVYNTAPRESVPGGLTDQFGVRVSEGEPVFANTVADISLEIDGTDYNGTNKYWTESLEPLGGQFIGHYMNTYRKGEAVVSVNGYVSGKAYYIGAGLSEEMFMRLISKLARDHGISRIPFELEQGVEVVKRYYREKPMYFVFNFRDEEATIEFDKAYMDLLGGNRVEGKMKLGAKGYQVLG